MGSGVHGQDVERNEAWWVLWQHGWPMARKSRACQRSGWQRLVTARGEPSPPPVLQPEYSLGFGVKSHQGRGLPPWRCHSYPIYMQHKMATMNV